MKISGCRRCLQNLLWMSPPQVGWSQFAFVSRGSGKWHDFEPIVYGMHELSYIAIIKRNSTKQDIKISCHFWYFQYTSCKGTWLWFVIFLFIATRKISHHQKSSSHQLWIPFAPQKQEEDRREGGVESCNYDIARRPTTIATIMGNNNFHHHNNMTSISSCLLWDTNQFAHGHDL